MDSAHGPGEAEAIDPKQPPLLDYDGLWAASAARSGVVFRVLIADVGLDWWDVALNCAQQAIADGYSGVSFEDGQGVLSGFALDISEDWVDFAHVDAEPGGIYALPLDHAQRIVGEIRAHPQ